jgi:glycine C-acetyltransferase
MIEAIKNTQVDPVGWIETELKTMSNQRPLVPLHVIGSAQGAWIIVDGQKMLNLCSNNYLGLAEHPELIQAAKMAMDKFGIGPAAVRPIAGNTVLHEELEKVLAEFKQVESVLTFSSGYTANLATITALVGKGDVIFSDRLNHASIIDGCRLSGAKIVPYNHGSVDHLRECITQEQATGYNRGLIVTDGVFSMDGDLAPLPDLAAIAKANNLMLMVDDAHGEGVMGRNGRGVVDHFGLHGQVDIEVGTFSKAFGVVGGMVTGRKCITDWLKRRGRTFLFSSAMTIPDVAACIASVQVLQKTPELVKRLWDNGNYLKTQLEEAGFNVGHSQTPIIPVILGAAEVAQDFSQRLFQNNIYATPIVYPMVSKDQARIRVMVSAVHERSDLDLAVQQFIAIGQALRIIK